MASSEELASFIASSFRSVWALELLLLLKGGQGPQSTAELVSTMRSSGSVVETAVRSLLAAGLVTVEDGLALYMPVSSDVALLVDETEQLYRSKPDRVRRLIIASSNKSLAAFSDAFRLRD